MVPASSGDIVSCGMETRTTEQKKLFQGRCFVSFDNMLIFTSRKAPVRHTVQFSQLKCFLEKGDDFCPNMLKIKSPGIDTDFCLDCLSLVKEAQVLVS